MSLSDARVMALVNALLIGVFAFIEWSARSHRKDLDAAIETFQKDYKKLTKAFGHVKEEMKERASSVASPPEKEKPAAGFSGVKVADENGALANAGKFAWSPCPGTSIKVRATAQMRKSGTSKMLSGESFYEAVASDLIRSNSEIIDNLNEKVVLPPLRECDDVDAIAKSGLPRIIIVNWVVPYKAPPLWGSNDPNDFGFNLVQYFAIKPETVDAVNSGSANGALKLLMRFMKDWKTDDDVRRRFKAIASADNFTELGLPSMFKGYNGKPVMIYKSGDASEGPGYFQMNIRVDRWKLLARKGIHSLMHKAPLAIARFGFVIQCESEDELPEQPLCIDESIQYRHREARVYMKIIVSSCVNIVFTYEYVLNK